MITFLLSDSSKRDAPERLVDAYNADYRTKQSVKDGKAFYAYYQDIAHRMKTRDRADYNSEKGIDILIVVNMFLTGFDVRALNTLYVDKELRHHSLIQAFSPYPGQIRFNMSRMKAKSINAFEVAA